MSCRSGCRSFGRFVVGRGKNKPLFIYTFIGYIIFFILWGLALALYPYKYRDFSVLHITISELGRSRKEATTRVFALFNTAMICLFPFFLPFVLGQFFRYREGLKDVRWVYVCNGLSLSGSLVALVGCLLIGVFHLDGVWGNKVHDGCAYVAFIGIILWMITASLVQMYRGAKGLGYPNIAVSSLGIGAILIVIVVFMGIGLSPWYKEEVIGNETVERALFIFFEWCGFFCYVSWLLFNVLELIVPPMIPVCTRRKWVREAKAAGRTGEVTVETEPPGPAPAPSAPSYSYSYSLPTHQTTTGTGGVVASGKPDAASSWTTGPPLSDYYPTSGPEPASPVVETSPWNPYYIQNVQESASPASGLGAADVDPPSA